MEKEFRSMADALFDKGFQIGFQKSFQKNFQIGMRLEERKTIKRMALGNVDMRIIKIATGLSESEIQAIIRSIEKEASEEK